MVRLQCQPARLGGFPILPPADAQIKEHNHLNTIKLVIRAGFELLFWGQCYRAFLANCHPCFCQLQLAINAQDQAQRYRMCF